MNFLLKYVNNFVQVAQEVHGLMDVVPDREQPLMAAGLDSRGGFELRRALGEALSIQLPVTLLYDYQSVAAMTEFIAEEVAKSSAADSAVAAADVAPAAGSLALSAGERALAAQQGRSATAGQPQPSNLLKILR